MDKNRKTLVIVESPTKARTITRFLPKGVTVMASYGHVRDLPNRTLGVDVLNNFIPNYVVSARNPKLIPDLKRAAKAADAIYLAPDPDREGEAIAWHLYELLKKDTKAPFHRVTFHEITPSAIQASFDHPGKIDQDKVDAQQARRVLDRIVGYQVSPLLWRHIQKGTSAGRVQSVAVRLVVERERQILAFKPQEYWNLDADFTTRHPAADFTARLSRLDGKKPEIASGDVAAALASELETKAKFKVAATGKKPARKSPAPPFITSTLQQAASGSLGFSTNRTMQVAQQLYEGIELGSQGAVGLITYMRTDSVNLAKEAVDACRDFIGKEYGARYLPHKPNVYKSGKSAQEAHEAIRPTDVHRTPDSVRQYLSDEQHRLYTVIWNRFVACQMAAAEFIDHWIDVAAFGSLKHDYLFHATARQTVFPGFQKVYDLLEPDQAEERAGRNLPELPDGTACDLRQLDKDQCFTEPPPRFSEATLVRELEQNGVGRPSTYASIVHTILDREYVGKEKGRLVPTQLGCKVNDYLVGRMPELFEVKFTAGMEALLDEVEEGKAEWTGMMKDFYAKFRGWLADLGVPAVPLADGDQVRELLDMVPKKIKWAPPEGTGRRVYDDGKFYRSLKEQVEGGKELSEKQWAALLGLAAKYIDQIPGGSEFFERLGYVPVIKPENDENGDAETVKREAASPEDLAVLKLLDHKDVKWAAPETRGKRTYDDKKFYLSLKEQAEGGKALSEKQRDALRRLVAKYQDSIKDYAAAAASFGLAPAAAAGGETEPADPAAAAEIAVLIAQAAKITKWEKPVQKGKKTYDDREFCESVTKQFTAKKSLSPRQINALRKMLQRYEGGGSAGVSAAKGGGTRPARPAPVATGVKCPLCKADLVERMSRRGKFYGCYAYPKCKFAVNSLDKVEK
jgi:DNA topoisomerase-1